MTIKHGSVPNRWLAWTGTWDPRLLLGVLARIEREGIDPDKATQDQVLTALKAIKGNRDDARRTS